MNYKCTTIFFHFRMFFVHLRVMLRNVPMKICAAVLAVWYLMSIIGFGVHTCMGSQRSFLTSFVSGITCEDIHPEHHCGEAHHCSGHHECHGCTDRHESGMPEIESSPCCSDDFMVITLTGTEPSSENGCHGCHCGQCPFAAELLSDIRCLSAKNEIYKIMPMPDSGLIAPGDVLSLLGIWRI